MDIQVIEYVTSKLFTGNPISDAFWLIDNRKAAILIFFLGLLATCYRVYLEKNQHTATLPANTSTPIKLWDWLGFTLLGLGAFSYSYGLTDEVFINLVHPLNLITNGIFSFDPTRKVDGTVENLFYLFHVIGGSPQGIIRFNFLFSFFLHLSSAIIVSDLFKFSSQQKLIRNLYVIFPPLVFAVSGGFGAVFLNFLFLLGIFSIINDKKALFCYVVALIALSRPEGAAFSIVLIAAGYIYKRPILKPLLMMILGALSFFGFYYFYYGHWIPTPLYFKALPQGCTVHLLDLFIRGFKIFSYGSHDSSIFIDTFLSESHLSILYNSYETIWKIFIYLAFFISIVQTLYILVKRFYNKEIPPLWAIYGVLLIGLLPIFTFYTDPPGSLGGQSRYYIVITSLIFLTLANLLHFRNDFSIYWVLQKSAKALLILFFIYTSYLYFGARVQLIYNRNFDANVGLLFKDLPSQFAFSSSEMDTLGFFSHRPMIDLWGYTTKAISQSGLYAPNFGKKVNPAYFLEISPGIEYNSSCTSKNDWSLDRPLSEKYGDKDDYNYSLKRIVMYPPKQRRDVHKHFHFPTEPAWLVDNTAMPVYHGDPAKLFASYNILFIHDSRQMFAFLLRKDLNQPFDTWAAAHGIKKVSTRITSYLPKYQPENYAISELPCKYYCNNTYS